MSFNATRLTCFALISAIETDFRDLILSLETDHDVNWSPSALTASSSRLARERATAKGFSHTDLIDYLDFADSYQILLSNRKFLHSDALTSLVAVKPQLEGLIAVRNRVAHSRPMEVHDLATTYDVARELTGGRRRVWDSLQTTLERLEQDPAFVLGLTVQLPSDPLDQPLHNLPIPDFDETGFFGRGRELQRIKKAVLGPWPVVSILGDGGIGKTAIALKAAYDLLDDSASNFDAVVWVTAKATTLTSGEIQNISGSIQDSLGMFAAAAKELGAAGSTSDPIDEVLEYLSEFRILLILDNLETVTDQRLRDFLLDMPNGSKVLITSRIGLGMENPVKLEPLSSHESKSLLRALASIRNIEVLKTMDDAGQDKLVSKLKGHPLFIKWLVAGVQSGRRPSELVNDNSLLLDFCMSNVYDKLSSSARQVLQSMQVMRGPRAQGELAYLNGYSAQQIQAALLELMTTNFVSMRRSGEDALDGSYETGDFASQYLARHQPVASKFREQVNSRTNALADLGQRMRSDRRSDRYSSNVIDIRGQHDVPAARLLVEAQRTLREGNMDEAINLCHEAQTLSPTYHEAWRIEAVVHEYRQDHFSTMAAFERAYELAEHSEIMAYHYAVYLCDGAKEHERGLTILQAAVRIDPESAHLVHQIARAHFDLGRYMETIDSCRALAAISQNPLYAAANIELALRAAVFGAERFLWLEGPADAAELVEACLDFLSGMTIEQMEAAHADWLMRLASISSRIVESAADDAYLTRRGTEFGSLFTDKVRVLDVESLERHTAQVVRVDRDRHFAFIRFKSQDFFFHHNDLRQRGDWPGVSENSLVAFRGDPLNSRGPRATDVRLLV